MSDIVTIKQQILKHPYFQKTKHIKETSPAHPEDSVYVHLIQTADFIESRVDGRFIQNTDARALFQKIMIKKIAGMTVADLAVIIGLVHDIGKIMDYQEEGNIFSSNQPLPNTDYVYNPNHGYYGSLLVKELLQDIGLPKEIVEYSANIVRLHLMPFDYYKLSTDYSLTQTIDDLKPRMEGLHVEVILNAYGDAAYNKPHKALFDLIEKMFEERHFFSTRKYFVK